METGAYLIETLVRTVRHLAQIEVEFAVAGGLAFSALVEPRSTLDMDFIILAEPSIFPEIIESFKTVFDAVDAHPAPMAFPNATIWRIVGYRRERDLVLDFILADRPYYREALNRKQSIPFEGIALPILSIEDLYITKALAGRLQDQADMEKIRNRYSPNLDWTYINRWLNHFDIPSQWPQSSI